MDITLLHLGLIVTGGLLGGVIGYDMSHSIKERIFNISLFTLIGAIMSFFIYYLFLFFMYYIIGILLIGLIMVLFQGRQKREVLIIESRKGKKILRTKIDY